MDNRDVAGQQVGQLRQEQGGTQVVHQPLVEETVMIARFSTRLGQPGQDGAIDIEIAFAAARRHDHIHAAENVGVALDAGAVERKPGGVDADALPGLHLALIALLGDLRVEAHRGERMHHVGGVMAGVGARLAVGERLPVCLRPFAQTRKYSDAGDPGFPTGAVLPRGSAASRRFGSIARRLGRRLRHEP